MSQSMNEMNRTKPTEHWHSLLIEAPFVDDNFAQKAWAIKTMLKWLHDVITELVTFKNKHSLPGLPTF